MFKKMDNLVLANLGVSLAVLGLVIYLVVRFIQISNHGSTRDHFRGGGGNRQGRRLERQLGKGGPGNRNRVGMDSQGIPRGGGDAARSNSKGVVSGGAEYAERFANAAGVPPSRDRPLGRRDAISAPHTPVTGLPGVHLQGADAYARRQGRRDGRGLRR